MNKLRKIIAAAAIIGFSASASAFFGGGPWGGNGGPWGGNNNGYGNGYNQMGPFDGMGSGDNAFDFNMSGNTRTNAYGRGYGDNSYGHGYNNSYYPNYGGGYYPPYGGGGYYPPPQQQVAPPQQAAPSAR